MIRDLLSGQYANPIRVIGFNAAGRWSEDVSEDIAREIQQRCDLEGAGIPAPLQAFVERHAGDRRQLTLRLV